jgi:hypothetical protein
MHNPTGKITIRARKETRDLVLSLWPESPRIFALRSIATSARNMGAHILHMTQKIDVSMIKTDQKKQISMPPRKAERNPISHRTCSQNGARSCKSLRR